MTNKQAPEIYTLHTEPNKGERRWSGIYTVRADAEHDAKVMRDVTGRDWSVVRFVVADTAPQPSPTPQADSAPADPDGEAFRTAARLGLTLRFYGGCAQSSMPGTPSAYEVVAGQDRATAMREAVERAAAVVARGGEPQRLDSLAPPTDSQPAPDYEAGWKDGYKHGAWSTQQPAPATKKLTEQICISDTNQSAACAVGNMGTTSDAQTTRSTHDAPATQQAGEVVAYLDVGANGYLDLGSELSEDALQQLPKGRHALVIAGTYGIDGYVAAPQPSPEAQQPAPSAACPVDNNNFDHQTAADVLNGKTVSDDAMRKFVAVARWAHDDRVGLRATLLSVRGELASREAEIALLKKALMDAEAPQPSRTPQADSQPEPTNTRQIAECYGDCPTDPKTCANPCKFEGRAASATAESVTASAGGAAVVEWHAPGLGEVHNESHGQLIFCTDGDDVADDTLARRVCAALNATPPAQAADSVLEDAARLERERICAAIKAEDDYCVDQGDYMLDSDDCIKIVRGEWVRPDFAVGAARKQGGAA